VQGIASAVLVLANSAKKIKLAVNLRSATRGILDGMSTSDNCDQTTFRGFLPANHLDFSEILEGSREGSEVHCSGSFSTTLDQ
jgi:hypothetical protein